MKLDTIESIAKIIGVAIACFGVYKYYDSLTQKKIDRSFSYFDEFHSGEVFDARIKVGELTYSWMQTENNDGTELDSDDLQEMILFDLSSKPGVIYFDMITEFFERAKKCIDLGGCEKESLVNLLSDDARTFYGFFFPKIAERQALGDKTSDGILCFATKFKGADCE